MKKLISTLLILIAIMIFTSSSTKAKRVPHSIKCYKCYESYINNNGAYGQQYSIATRSFGDEYNNRKMKGYCIYHCQYGHTLYINYDNGDKK